MPPPSQLLCPGGRRLLFAGFGGLLALMLAAGVDALLVLHKVRTSDAQVRDLYSARTQSLERVRNGIYQSAILMRDYLLATDPVVASAQVDQLARDSRSAPISR